MAKTKKSKTGAAVLAHSNYGKSRVRMVKVSRKGKRHTVCEISADISLAGDFEAVHTRGDNRHCLPTDTMKNTVYALGKDHPIDTIESFAMHLAEHFLSRNKHVSGARVHIEQVPWDRVRIKGKEHPHCFTKGSQERQACEVLLTRDEWYISSGIDSLTILKSTDSAFSGYPKDEYTTLPETRDRIFATSLNASWHYAVEPKGSAKIDFTACRAAIRTALVETFAHHKSESVQHTMYAMGEAALRACKHIYGIHLSMPNKHCLLVNLAPFKLTNKNEIFVPTDEPHGLIEATIVRE